MLPSTPRGRFWLVFASAVAVVAVDASVAEANYSRLCRNPTTALVALEVAVLLCNNLAGIAAVVLCGRAAADPALRADREFILLGGAAGGAWCAYAWFGWPFVTVTYFGTLGHPIEKSVFSLGRAIGLLVFGVVGYGAATAVCEAVEGQAGDPRS